MYSTMPSPPSPPGTDDIEYDRCASEARAAHWLRRPSPVVRIPPLTPLSIEWWTTLAQLRGADL